MEGYYFQYEYNDEDLVVLAGDIHSRGRHRELIYQIPFDVPIIMVAGNHEYYDSDFAVVNKFLKKLEILHPNFHFLQNESIEIDGVHFYGGTMFTDFRLYGETESWFSKQHAKAAIADFQWITNNGRLWTVIDHEEEHQKFRDGLETFIAQKHERQVVISHFMATDKVANPKFAGSNINPYFTANMERFMGWKGLWLCGHGHSSADVMIGDTRVVMNPRGYGQENAVHTKERYGFLKNFILEI